jgi:hypothetical protein
LTACAQSVGQVFSSPVEQMLSPQIVGCVQPNKSAKSKTTNTENKTFFMSPPPKGQQLGKFTLEAVYIYFFIHRTSVIISKQEFEQNNLQIRVKNI